MPKLKAERRSEAGFSLLEGLIAAALLLIVTVGILPLFSRAMQNNLKGNDSTRQANGATDEFERSIALPFNSGAMDVVGAATQMVETRAIALKDLGAVPAGPSQGISSRWELLADLGTNDQPLAQRQRTLRQFSFDDLQADQNFDNALAGDVEDRLVQFKIVDVSIDDPSKPLARPFQLRSVQAW